MDKLNYDEFEIIVDFEKNSEQPSKIFKAIYELIDSLYSLDMNLVGSFSTNIDPKIVLEDIQTGSIKTVLKNTLKSIDDEALKELSLKKIVGSFLVKSKYKILKLLEDKDEISDIGQVKEIETEIQKIAEETNVNKIPMYIPISSEKLLNNISLINQATANLSPNESVTYVSEEGEVYINNKLNISSERIEELLTREIIEQKSEMLLKIKKPDYLGNSMWDMYHEDKFIQVKINDLTWLDKFQSRQFDVRPGDCIRGIVKIILKFGHNNTVIAEHYSIEKVLEIKHKRNSDNYKLFDDYDK